jgi:hypothetical protein
MNMRATISAVPARARGGLASHDGGPREGEPRDLCLDCVVTCVVTLPSLPVSGPCEGVAQEYVRGSGQRPKPHEHRPCVSLLLTRCHSVFFRPLNSGPGGRRFKSSLPDQLIPRNQ